LGIMNPIHIINIIVLKSLGRSDLTFRLEIIKNILATIAIFSTFRWGIIALLSGQIGASLLGYFFNTYFTGKLLNYPIHEQVQDWLPGFILACMMGMGIYVVKYAQIDNSLILLATQVFSGAAIYLILCNVFKLSSYVEIYGILKSKILHN